MWLMVLVHPHQMIKSTFFRNWQWNGILSIRYVLGFYLINIAQHIKRQTISIKGKLCAFGLFRSSLHLCFINSSNSLTGECEVTLNQDLANIWFFSFSKRKQWLIQPLSVWFSTNFNFSRVHHFQKFSFFISLASCHFMGFSWIFVGNSAKILK